MKPFLTLVIFFLAMTASMAQKSNPNYDEELATRLGADEYGMKSYVFVILKTGSNESPDKELSNKAFSGHMENMSRLVEEKKLIVAGPFVKNDKGYRGIFILDVPTIEEANLILNTDPAIQAKYLDTEVFMWYGSAALSEYLEASDKVWKTGF